MRTTDHSINSGSHLTVQEIERCREQLSDLIIAPFDPAHAKGVGYNLSSSEMIYSITRSRFACSGISIIKNSAVSSNRSRLLNPCRLPLSHGRMPSPKA